MIPLPRHLTRQLALQGAAYFLALVLLWPYFALRGEQLPATIAALTTGAGALLLASITRQAWWWRVIHALFAPGVWAMSGLAIAPGWYLLAFALLLLVYRGAVVGRVPLYLSNGQTIAALADIVGKHGGSRFLDLGAGVGSVVSALARRLPEVQVDGVENAPLTWLIGRLRTAGLSHSQWQLGNMWEADLAPYDVVYAFLSPAPMAALWRKAESEMRDGSLLLSNSFAVPDVAPDETLELDDGRRTRLYCYRIARSDP